MARQQGYSVENSFAKGLITEATGLNFPENACTETDNCIFNRIGSVQRRTGIDFEEDWDPHAFDPTGKAITEFLWKGVTQSGEITLAVIQIGSSIKFFSIDSAGTISANLKAFTVSLSTYKAAEATTEDVAQNNVSFTAGNGFLFIAHPYCNPIYVDYDSDTDTIDTTEIILKVRDTGGIPNLSAVTSERMEANHRPTDSEISQSAYYNLLNQGWYTTVACTPLGKTWTTASPLVAWRQGAGLFIPGSTAYAREDWPSEADVWHAYKGPILPSTSSGNPLPPIPPAEGFSLQAIDKVDLGNYPTGKGHFILDALNEDRYTAAYNEDTNNSRGVFTALGDLLSFSGELTNKTSGKQRPSQIAFYAGRVWYSGVNAKDYNTSIYFSQILESDQNINRCYQSQDPTSDVSSDLLPSDGGVIIIPEAARIVKLFAADTSIYVFATNGIWRISGSSSDTGLGFTANAYSVTKVSNVGVMSALSFVNAEGSPIWWTNTGIWALKGNQAGSMEAQSISLPTIETYISAVPTSEVRFIKGCYNPFDKVIQWLFRDTESQSVEDRYKYNKILNFDMTTGAFYPWSVSDDHDYIAGILNIKDVSTNIVTENVLDAAADIVTDSGVNVTVDLLTSVDLESSFFKYVVFMPNGSDHDLTFATNMEGVYEDFSSTDGEDGPVAYSSYFTTGYKVRGEAIKKFQSTYLMLYSSLSTFDIHGRWDYATTGDTGRWSSVQRITTASADYTYQPKRIKIRGHGKALQFRVTSVDDEPFSIIGWAALESSNQAP